MRKKATESLSKTRKRKEEKGRRDSSPDAKEKQLKHSVFARKG